MTPSLIVRWFLLARPFSFCAVGNNVVIALEEKSLPRPLISWGSVTFPGEGC